MIWRGMVKEIAPLFGLGHSFESSPTARTAAAVTTADSWVRKA